MLLARRTLYILLGGASLFLLVTLFFWSTFFERDPFARRKFNSVEWRAWTVAAKGIRSHNPRGFMARDLISTHLRVGANRTDVVRLIGPPDEVGVNTNYLGYYLGGHSGNWYRPGYDYLWLSFDARDRLESVKIDKEN
jgi:hypothetical protein